MNCQMTLPNKMVLECQSKKQRNPTRNRSPPRHTADHDHGRGHCRDSGSLLKQEALESSEFDINAAVRNVGRMLTGEFNNNDTRVALNLHPSPVHVNGSRVQVEQVLINLAINSLHALRSTEPGVRAIRFTTNIADGKAEFAVSDSGPGIAADDHKRIFAPFMSGGDGLGMGLAICKRIVESHDGTIRVEDGELGGARFVVALPLSEPGVT